MDEIREKYGALLANEAGEFAGLVYRPVSLLPYPKEEIRKALTALLEYAQGLRESRHLHPRIRKPSVVDTLMASLLHLDTFLDVAADVIPREPQANVEFGVRYTHGTA